ncbi:MAG: PQQ-dependent sugar dehydrogenase [Cytophagaceae bacterium]
MKATQNLVKVKILAVFFIGVTALTFFFSCPSLAQLPEGFIVNRLTGNVINEAVAMAHAPDGRIFLAERGGNIKVYKDGTVTTVHTVSTTTAVEQGLLGITLHPNFPANGKFYIYYTKPDATVHYLDVVSINPQNQIQSSARVMEFDPIINGFHNGGAMLFKDGFLYICIGESNSPATSVNLNTYMGKVLRLTEDGDPAPGNPYYNESGANRQRRSIWAIGKRNPWTMSMDPQSGKIFVVDVGGSYEEVNDITSPDPSKNYNYGWDQNGRSGSQQLSTTIAPYFFYGHPGWGCAITTGAAYNPSVSNYPPQYRGRFYFTDWCSGWLRSFDINNPDAGYQQLSASGFNSILGLSAGIDGNLYFINYNTNGSLSRIEYTLATTPQIVNHPESKTVYPGDPVTFSVTASGAIPFSYQWMKGHDLITGATEQTLTIPFVTANDGGEYRCIVTNTFGNVTSNAAALTVRPFNAKPVAKILTPFPTQKWSVLDVINYTGSATDEEDGELPASVYEWEVQLFHKDCETCEHWHPGPAAQSGVKSGTFIADNGGETSHNIWIRLLLKVTDSEGRTGKDSVDIYPNKVDLTFTSNHPGLLISLGNTSATPFSKTVVVNASYTLQAITPQSMGNNIYEFQSWSHGGNATQTFRMPAINTTYTATYSISSSLQNPFQGMPVNIPGRVEAENFDTGGQGIAYHDASAGNAGNAYRTNENVDIEACSEGGFNIGYVSAGEWLKYTVNVTQSGIYTIGFRVSSTQSNRSLHVELDGQNITGSVALPNTGGWQNWQTVYVQDLSLSAGTQIIRLVFDTPDLNINYMDFTLVVISNVNANSTGYEIYPNPVSDQIKIINNSKSSDAVTIILYDQFGQKLKEVKQELFNEIILDISQNAPGIYYVNIIREGRYQSIKVIKQ